MDNARWIHLWTCIIAGPTGAAKTVFVRDFLKNLRCMTETEFLRVILHYTQWQPAYEDLRADGYNIKFREGLPQSDDFTANLPKLVILDDLMHGCSGNTVVEIFTEGSHHKNLSVFYLKQNLFLQGRGQRDIPLNAHYLIIFKNPRDRAQIKHLARQVHTEDLLFLQEAYIDATARPHDYPFLDLKQTTSELHRVRTNIFPSDAQQGLPAIVCVPK